MLGDFYTVIEKKTTERGFDVRVRLNSSHLIYQAHFPEHPVTPGVCILQMCQELLAAHYEKALQLKGAKNIKFLNVLSPLEHPEVMFSVKCEETDTGIKAMVVLSDAELEFAKLSTEYCRTK